MKKLSERKKKWIERTVANDRSYKLWLYNRFFIFLLLALTQVVVLIEISYLLVYHSAIGILLQLGIGVGTLVALLHLINQNDRPSSRVSWILLILLLPFLGVPTYLLYGEGRPTKKMQQKIAQAKQENAKSAGQVCVELENSPEIATEKLPQNRADGIGWYLSKYAEYPVYTNGDVRYFNSGEQMFPVILQALQEAKQFILIEYFIIAAGKMWGEILKILLQKAMEGVEIKIIYDDFGCMVTLPPHYDRYLESLHPNIKCMAFNQITPLIAVRMNNRDHRKIIVVDGKTAFTGGINLADEYINEKRRFGYWKDSGVQITGNAVNSFTGMFFYLWNAFRKDKADVCRYLTAPKKVDEGIRIQPYDDSPLDKMSVGESVYVDMIHRAARSVWIFTPYLLLDDYMRAALCMAAMRGVDVRIVTPGIPDKKTTYRLTRANYAVLMRAGVKIYEYTPGFIHAKSMLCDGEYAVVGTINLDYRSLYLHFENAVYFSGCEAVAELKKDCEETFAVSKLCTLNDPKRTLLGRWVDAVLRLFETLM